MSKNGFDAEDLNLTLARFAGKRRNISFDKSKLKVKAPESITFSSATNVCGKEVLNDVASLIPAAARGQTGLEEVYDEFGLDGWKSGTQGFGYYRKGIKD